MAAARGTEASSPGRETWIDAGRGLAIVLVTIYHAANWSAVGGFDVAWWTDLNAYLASLRMPLFFALSGVLGSRWLSRDWRPLLERKILPLAWVFVLWTASASLVFFVVMAMNGPRTTILRLALELTWTPVLPRFELWFVWVLAVAFVLARATRRVPWQAQLGLASVLSLATFGQGDGLNVAWLGLGKYYMFFLVGMYLRAPVMAAGRHVTPVVVVPVVMLWVVVGTVLAPRTTTETTYSTFLFSVTGLAAGVVVCQYLGQSRVLRHLGGRTLPIYVTHTAVVSLTVYALWSVGVPERLPGWVGLLLPPVLSVLAVLVALVLHHASGRSRWAAYLFAPPPTLARVLRLSSTARSTVPPGGGEARSAAGP